jgi:high-affinity Fe2+/Pb2+ permease
MAQVPRKQNHHLVSKQGVIAGVICAVIPLTVTGILLFRYLTQKGSFDDFLMTAMVIVIVFAIMQMLMNFESNKLYKQLMAEDFTPPSNKFKLLYGAAQGMMVSLIGMLLTLSSTYFIM